jgi:HPt (histidine-containing phosphotransfer) domain-containing protein
VSRLTEAQRAQLEALRQSYRAELPAKLGLIGVAVDTLYAGGWGKAHLQALYDLIHKLTGSAAIYGFGEIARAAGEVESWALQALDGALSESSRLELAALMSALQEAFRQGETAGASDSGQIRGRGSRASR